MRPVGFFRGSWEIAAKDLRLEWRTFETLSSSFIFSLIILVIFNFAFGFSTIKELGADRLVPGVIPALRELAQHGYRFVMVSNQDGLGTSQYPQQSFQKVQSFC